MKDLTDICDILYEAYNDCYDLAMKDSETIGEFIERFDDMIKQDLFTIRAHLLDLAQEHYQSQFEEDCDD